MLRAVEASTPSRTAPRPLRSTGRLSCGPAWWIAWGDADGTAVVRDSVARLEGSDGVGALEGCVTAEVFSGGSATTTGTRLPMDGGNGANSLSDELRVTAFGSSDLLPA